ncbi:hypothetical protein HY487_01830 [Candidatus Woesearchaeota archaeon]|nr:hypothetical protein [Candidatus Woesearchaeota archaeon]
MNHVDYPCKLNDKALELNVTWMDKWFRGELFGISGGRGLTLGETTKRLLQFYRGLENVVEEEAFDLGFVKKPKSEGTCLTIVAPELPTYQVAIMAARLIRNYQYQPNSDALNLQEILEKEKQDFWKGEEELVNNHPS